MPNVALELSPFTGEAVVVVTWVADNSGTKAPGLIAEWVRHKLECLLLPPQPGEPQPSPDSSEISVTSAEVVYSALDNREAHVQAVTPEHVAEWLEREFSAEEFAQAVIDILGEDVVALALSRRGWDVKERT